MPDSETVQAVYRPADIQQILACSVSTARKIIADLNKELQAQGYYTLEARVPVAYFREKYHLD